VIKPDLVHYGGSCSIDLTHIAGIRSVNGTTCAENLGTSFATPLVSRTLAQIYHQVTPTPSPVLARALLTHHARDPRTKQRVPDGDENFFRETGAIKTKFVGLVPPEHKNAGILYESYQVEKLRKWAPVRTYYGNLGEKGERGDRWRLKLQLLTRHAIEESGKYAATTVHHFATLHHEMEQAVDRKRCCLLDVFRERLHVAPQRFQPRRRQIEAACREIASKNRSRAPA
jgi:hypothetical protein